jgi:coenzyme F420-0:L-glutamate ligase/coenzyme F420-1:gamma-L-glutamate ligase
MPGEMIKIIPLDRLGEVEPDADLVALIRQAMDDGGIAPRAGDVLVISQKSVSKAEGRFVDLGTVRPGERALELAAVVAKDPRLVELILSESIAVVRASHRVLITRHRSGHVMANAGIDQSNLGRADKESVLLLPVDADESAERLRAGLAASSGTELAVIIADSFGRPWRQGVVNVAIGVSGLPALVDVRGAPDRDRRPLEVTQIGLGDLLASAAGLVFGEADAGVPAAIVRGVRWDAPSRPASALVRPLDEDLFR